MLKIDGLTKVYGDKKAVDDLSLHILPGEIYGFIGHNGAGKTTTLKAVAGILEFDGGNIYIDGKNIKNETVQSHRDRFAAVFQDFQIFAATMGENVALDYNVDKGRAAKALENSGYTKELPNGMDSYLLREFDDEGIMMSGGESQKVAIARAFYKKCPYVILDEPSANLDPIAEYMKDIEQRIESNWIPPESNFRFKKIN